MVTQCVFLCLSEWRFQDGPRKLSPQHAGTQSNQLLASNKKALVIVFKGLVGAEFKETSRLKRKKINCPSLPP